jgi:hypothetical protein
MKFQDNIEQGDGGGGPQESNREGAATSPFLDVGGVCWNTYLSLKISAKNTTQKEVQEV